MEKKLTKIKDLRDKRFFVTNIKRFLREHLNENGRISDSYGFHLYNGDNNSHVEFGLLPNKGVGAGEPIGSYPKGGITVENFMYGNGFELGSCTTDRNLLKVAHRIIDYYNDHVDFYNECYN